MDDAILKSIKPFYSPDSAPDMEYPSIQHTIDTLHLQRHIEGGYFFETDRDPLRIPNPFGVSSAQPLSHQPGKPT
jgi:hypothetical protein